MQVVFSSGLALWLRNSFAPWYSYFFNFLLLGWLCVSWALLFPFIVQPKSVVLVTSFFIVFSSLLFSGGIKPVEYSDIYSSTGVAIFSGLLSPTRYFIEAMAVAESKCLPVSSHVQCLRHPFDNIIHIRISPVFGVGSKRFYKPGRESTSYRKCNSSCFLCSCFTRLERLWCCNSTRLQRLVLGSISSFGCWIHHSMVGCGLEPRIWSSSAVQETDHLHSCAKSDSTTVVVSVSDSFDLSCGPINLVDAEEDFLKKYLWYDTTVIVLTLANILIGSKR